MRESSPSRRSRRSSPTSWKAGASSRADVGVGERQPLRAFPVARAGAVLGARADGRRGGAGRRVRLRDDHRVGGVGSLLGSVAAMKSTGPPARRRLPLAADLESRPARLAAAAPVWAIAASALVGSVAMNFAGTIWITVLQKQHPAARALARQLVRLARLAALYPLGYILVGPLAEAFGVADVLFAAALVGRVELSPSSRSRAIATARRDAQPATSEVDPLTATQTAG